MSWFTNFLTSSIGKKIIMSLTGLFLISFLVVHLAGNLQLLVNDEGESFNVYAKFMTTNPLIKFISYGLYAGILLHAVQ
ncbi:MAG: succinate dehydrogenase, partial [Bacteroidota bacterium]